MGIALARELDRRGLAWQRGDWRTPVIPPSTTLVINAAAYIPKPSVIACDTQPAATIQGNLLLPLHLAHLCARHDVPLAHISTGCLWTDGQEHDEDSPPQRGFGGHCGTYVGVKILAEDAVRTTHSQHYIWRVRLPFDEFAGPRNYLSKLAAFQDVWEQVNSATHRADFARAALDLVEARAPWGTYHLVNPGSLSARDVVTRMKERGIFPHEPRFIEKGLGACRLSVEKALATGITIRSASEALDDALTRWTP